MSIATEITRLQTAKADIKSAIEEKGVEVGNGTIDTYAEKVREISVGGEGINLIDYCTYIGFENRNIFGTPEVTLNLPNVTKLDYLFPMPTSKNTNTTIEHITINCPNQITSARTMFGVESGNDYDNKIKKITLNVDTSKCTGFFNAFKNMRGLEVIDGTPLDLSSVVGTMYYPSLNGMFDYAYALKEVSFVENTIKINISFGNLPNLNNKTKQSIFDGLATVDTAQTLTLHANTKILQSQVDSANAKGWTVAGGVVVSEEEYYG